MINTKRATGTGAIALRETQAREWQLEEVRVHLGDVGGSGDLTVTLDAAAGSTYDAILFKQDMTAVKDLVWAPDRPILLDSGDAVVVDWANAGGETYGVEIKHRAAVNA